jgi:hypothetical protein
MDSVWALQARGVGSRRLAIIVGRQAEACYRTSVSLLSRSRTGRLPCLFANPGFSNARGTGADGCTRGPVLGVRVARNVGRHAQGKVLPGTKLASQIRHRPHGRFTGTSDPLAAHYPDGRLPSGPPSWRNLGSVPPSKVLHAADADAIFNAAGSRYRIAFNFSHYGGAPVNVGAFSGSGGDDLAISDHYAAVDGRLHAGEVDLYYGRRGHGIDPRVRAPDIVFYGDQPRAKLGISIAPAGDVNKDGWPDFLMAAAFHSTDAGRIRNAGTIYLVYGGFLQQFRCSVKVRVGDIGRAIPGIRFEAGYDHRLYAGWANELDSGDANGDGASDVLIGAYDLYSSPPPKLGARAYLIFGSSRLPMFERRYRLGLDRSRHGIRSSIFEDPDPLATDSSLGFSASFVGDITGSGHDAIAFAAAMAGAHRQGQAYIFTRRFDPATRAPIDMLRADTVVDADQLDQGSLHLRFTALAGARPAGDVNGDGVGDVLLTARYTRSLLSGSWTPVGAAGVLYGRRSGLLARVPFSQLDHIYYGDQRGQIGQPASDHGADFTGDGAADVLIADPYYLEPIGNSIQERGRMWMIAGGAGQPRLVDVEAAANRYLVADTRLPGLFGFTWDTGDFNGDHRPDLVVSDHYEGDRALDVHAGVVYLFGNRQLR